MCLRLRLEKLMGLTKQGLTPRQRRSHSHLHANEDPSNGLGPRGEYLIDQEMDRRVRRCTEGNRFETEEIKGWQLGYEDQQVKKKLPGLSGYRYELVAATWCKPWGSAKSSSVHNPLKQDVEERTRSARYTL